MSFLAFHIQLDRLFDIHKCLGSSRALRNTSWQGRNLSYEDPVFVWLNEHTVSEHILILLVAADYPLMTFSLALPSLMVGRSGRPLLR